MTLLPPDVTDRSMLCAASMPGRRGATVASVMAHVAALALLVCLTARLPPAAPELPAFAMFFDAPAAAPQTLQRLAGASLAPSMVRQAPRPLSPLVRLRAATVSYPPYRSLRTAARAVDRDAAPPRAATAPAGPTAPPATSPPGASDDGAILVRFADTLQATVRAAAAMPEAAVRQHREGRAQVRFAYLDGHVEQVAVAQSSRSRVLDDAALAAVQQAHYPPPPPQLRGRKLPLLVWIDFSLPAPPQG
jgi:protein TonB